MAEIRKADDKAQEENTGKTPEAAAVSGVIGGQPNQEIHMQASVVSHANDTTLSEPDMIAMKEHETPEEYKARIAQIQENRFGFFDSETEAKKISAGSVAPKTNVFEHPSKHALESMPPVSSVLDTPPYGSAIKLNVQITNVPEVSDSIKPQELMHYADVAFEAGAQAVRPVEKYMAQPNAVNDSLVGIGPVLDNAVNYYANTAADQVGRDIQAALGFAGETLENALSHALTPEERAKDAGTVMPLFFFESNVKEPIHPETVQQLGLDGLQESELSELGILRITRKAGKGGDWPVLNERPSPDVVRQATPEGCVAAVGEMLSEGRFVQSELFPEVRTIPEELARKLGPEWISKFVNDKESAFGELQRRGKAWGAELHDTFFHRIKMGHMVVVDGIDEVGNVVIRDPQDATRYEMTRQDFMEYWTARGVWR
ncbi:MAG: hypothetical protein C0469_00570 [Cyanobacteria bacterium DS2.3.42]|nr:hypothetical protein [Cyanobacteria bacterium DS2.3.42]